MQQRDRVYFVSLSSIVWMMWIFSSIPSTKAELTVEAEHPVLKLPQSNAQLYAITNIACFISPSTRNVRWITPDGTSVLDQTGPYTITHGDIALLNSETKYGSLLIVEELSYEKAGVYVCEVMEEGNCSSAFPIFAKTELILSMELTVSRSSMLITYNQSFPQTAELECEASGYIRSDSDIVWFKNNQQIAEGGRYSIVFGDGRPDAAQTGLNDTVPSRVSLLTINQVVESDTGIYSCQSQTAGNRATVHLQVELEEESPTSTTTGSSEVHPPNEHTQTPSQPSATLSRSGQASEDCSVDIAAAVIATFILTVIIAVVAGFGLAFLWLRWRKGRRIKSGISSPDLGSTTRANSDTNLSGEVGMYRITTGAHDEMEGSSGDTPDTLQDSK